ncbi:MAG: hypothetical protein KGL39_51945 [Patescibacteria group bacterium]|nr:hypothetical protein [Patescibacteria group bacterium]
MTDAPDRTMRTCTDDDHTWRVCFGDPDEDGFLMCAECEVCGVRRELDDGDEIE